MPRLINLKDKVFGRLQVLQRNPRKDGVFWDCICTCGTLTTVMSQSLRRLETRSCGCLKLEILSGNKHNIKHGYRGTPTYNSWGAMLDRVRNPIYKNHHGRGISVCSRWETFENFLADMGERPKGLTLDRIDNNGDYEPSNCKWDTRKQQTRNRRVTKLNLEKAVEIINLASSGVTQHLIAKKFNITQSAVSGIINGRIWCEAKELAK